MIYHDLPWFTMIYHDLPWFTMIYHDLPWFTMIYRLKMVIFHSYGRLRDGSRCWSQFDFYKKSRFFGPKNRNPFWDLSWPFVPQRLLTHHERRPALSAPGRQTASGGTCHHPRTAHLSGRWALDGPGVASSHGWQFFVGIFPYIGLI